MNSHSFSRILGIPIVPCVLFFAFPFLYMYINCSAIIVSNSNNEDSHNNDNSIILENNLTTTNSNETSRICALSRADDHAFSDKECTINCSSTHYNNSNDTYCDHSCIDGYITTDEACNVFTNKPPPPSFQKQLNQYRERQQLYFFKTSLEQGTNASPITQYKSHESCRRQSAPRHITRPPRESFVITKPPSHDHSHFQPLRHQKQYSDRYPFRKRRCIIPSYRTVHRHHSLEWLAHLDTVASLTKRQ